MAPLKVGVIGVGALGQHHARLYAAMGPAVELVGVADTVEGRAAEVAGRFGTAAFTDFHPLLEKVQAVSIAVPTRHHHFVGRACLQRGVHALIEKPLAASLVQADDLLATAKTHGVILQVGHVERFNAAIRALHGLDPRPLFIEVHRLGPFSPRTADVGVVLDLMIHDLDIVLNIKGTLPSRVEAVGTPVFSRYEDIATARLEFPDGCVANLTASRITQEKQRKIRLFCNDRYITVDYMRQDVCVFRLKDGGGAPWMDGDDWLDRVVVERPALVREEPLKLELESFVRTVATGSEPEVSGAKAREAMAVADMVVEDLGRRLARFRAAS
jgi:predicted dehydrogenase